MERNDKILVLKWDSFCKHVGHKKVKKDISYDAKKGDWYYTKTCKHVKNHVELANHNYQIVAMQLVNGITRKKARIV